MPVRIRFTDNGLGVIMTGSGIVTGEEILNANKDAYARATEPLIYQLFEGDKITGLSVSTNDLRAAADQDIAASKRMPNTIVAVHASDDLPFGLARMWDAFVQETGWKTNVFRTRSEAEAWLKEEVRAKLGVELTFN